MPVVLPPPPGIMKLIQLGGPNDALCHFLSFGGYELLLDCGVSLTQSNATGDDGSPTTCVRLPALPAVDVASLDAILISNHTSMLALPFLTQRLGFKGDVYATDVTLRVGRVLLDELCSFAREWPLRITFELPPAGSSTDSTPLSGLTLDDVASCCERVKVVEFKEVTRLSYGVSFTALSSGFALGSAMWLLESPSERVAYVAAASGDLNRHPKELDFTPLTDCDTLIVTDIKPERDAHATTEVRVEQLLAAVSRVTERGGVCILPMSFAGAFFDLIEAIYAACIQNKPQQLPMLLVSSFAEDMLETTQCGAEFVCEKKMDKLYGGEPAFAHELLLKSKALQIVPKLTNQIVSKLQHGGVVFVSHPTLRLGPAADLVRLYANDARNALLLTDATLDVHEVLTPFYAKEIEKLMCPIDARLSCGDVNQFIARCAPRNLIVPSEYLVDSTSSSVKSEPDQQREQSHFARVLPLQQLIAARPKTELETFAMETLEPINLDKSNKYIEGKLDPKLAAQTMMVETNGKGVALVRGRIGVRGNHEYFVEASTDQEAYESGARSSGRHLANVDDGRMKLTGSKRKAPSSNTGPTLSPPNVATKVHPSVEYREKSSMLLGQVDEDKLSAQIKSHDSQLDVYISQGPNNADAMLSIPALDARITLWKETGKTVIETPKEDARVLLRSLVLTQLLELSD